MRISKVLVVDDQVLICSYLERKLGSLGYEVVAAYNGVEALEVAFHEAPDALILDVSLPGLDGYEVCRRLKADARTCDTPVIMLTALSTPEHRRQAFDAGANAYITKPTDFGNILEQLKSFEKV